MKTRTKFRCLDCLVDTGRIGEHYMLRDSVWNSVASDGMLCVGCLEIRLGRRLTREDFNNSHINRPVYGKFFSQRLTERLL